jgi:hypothetical protein
MASVFHMAKNTWCVKRGGKTKKNESSLEALLHGCHELLDKMEIE